MIQKNNQFMKLGVKLNPTALGDYPVDRLPSCPCNSETVYVDVLIPDVDWVDPIRVDIGYIGSHTVYGDNFDKLTNLYISGTIDVFDDEELIPESTYTGIPVTYTVIDKYMMSFDSGIPLVDGFFTLIMVDDDDNIIKWTDQDSGFGVKVGLGFDDPPIPHECPELIIRSDVDWVYPISVGVLDPTSHAVYGDEFTNLKHVYVSGTTGVFNGEVNIPNSSFTGVLVNHTTWDNTHIILDDVTPLTDGYYSLVMVDIDDVVYKWTNQFAGYGVKSGIGYDPPVTPPDNKTVDVDWVDPIHVPLNIQIDCVVYGNDLDKTVDVYVSGTDGVFENEVPIGTSPYTGVNIGYNVIDENHMSLDSLMALDDGYFTVIIIDDDDNIVRWTNQENGFGVICGHGFYDDDIPPVIETYDYAIRSTHETYMTAVMYDYQNLEQLIGDDSTTHSASFVSNIIDINSNSMELIDQSIVNVTNMTTDIYDLNIMDLVYMESYDSRSVNTVTFSAQHFDIDGIEIEV